MSRNFFNEKAFAWDETSHHDEKKLDIIVENLNLKPKNIVLDIGTGTGVLLSRLKASGRKVLALDPAENMLYMARKKLHNLKVYFIQGICEELPLRSNSCHRVICYSVFPHFKEQLKSVSEIHRVLVPGGRLVIAHSERWEKINNLHRNISGPVCHDYLPDREELSSMLKSCGFQIKNIIDSEEMYCFAAEKK